MTNRIIFKETGKKDLFSVLTFLIVMLFSFTTISCNYKNIKADIIEYDQLYHSLPEWDKLENLQKIVGDNLSLNTFDIYELEKALINVVETREEIIETLGNINVPSVLEKFQENKLNQLIYRNKADTMLLEDFRLNLLTNSYDTEKSQKSLDEINALRKKSEEYFFEADRLRKDVYSKYGLDDLLPEE